MATTNYLSEAIHKMANIEELERQKAELEKQKSQGRTLVLRSGKTAPTTQTSLIILKA
jgi:hypothetical protein